MTAFGLLTVLMVLARGVNDIIVLRLLSGISFGGAVPCCIAMNGEYTPKRRRGTAILLLYAAWPVGQMFIGLLAAAWIETRGWRLVPLVCGGAALVLAALLYFFLPESVNFLGRHPLRQPEMLKILRRIDPQLPAAIRIVLEPNEKDAASLRFLLQGEMLAATALVWSFYFFILLAVYGYQTWLPTLLVNAGHPMATAVLAGTIYSMGGLVATILLGPVVDWQGPFRVGSALSAGAAIFTVALGFCGTASLPILMAIIFMIGFGCMGSVATMATIVVILYPTALRTIGVGWAQGFGRFGAIAGPMVIGLVLVQRLPWAGILSLFAVPVLLSAMIVIGVGKIVKRRDARLARVGLKGGRR